MVFSNIVPTQLLEHRKGFEKYNWFLLRKVGAAVVLAVGKIPPNPQNDHNSADC